MAGRILIVEDDEDLVRLSTHWLEREGYKSQVEEAVGR